MTFEESTHAASVGPLLLVLHICDTSNDGFIYYIRLIMNIPLKITFLIHLFFFNLHVFAGKDEKDKNKCEKYIAKGYVESKKLTKPPILKINFSLKDFFPKEAKEKGIKTGKSIVQIFLNKKGKLVCSTIMQKSEGYGFDKAAIQIIRKAKFSPGELKGKQVDSYVVLPVEFSLD